MPHRNEASVVVARPPEDVFPWLVEPEKRLQWVEGLESTEEVGERRHREVLSAHGIHTVVDVEVRRLEPPHALELHLTAKQFVADASTYATAADGGTRVESTIDADYRGFMARAAAPMITRQAQSSLERSLQRLKELVEAGAA